MHHVQCFVQTKSTGNRCRNTVNNNSGYGKACHIHQKQYDDTCCRCFTRIQPGQELGGRYGGVVCKIHRVCDRCWWDKNGNYGGRTQEPIMTQSIPLVNGPRNKVSTICFGCVYRRLPSIFSIIEPPVFREEDGIIILD